jgi:hypothetical protein
MGTQSPNVGALIDLFDSWVPDERTRLQILVKNPALLYGFADSVEIEHTLPGDADENTG